MPNPNPPTAESSWQQRASHLALRLNFHHWLARVVPLFFVLLVALALFEIFRRETGLSTRWSGSFFSLGLIVATGWAWLRARNHFCTTQQALVRLETVLGLHNRLSAAQDGIVPWPVPQGKIDDSYTTNWKQILVPLLAGSLFVWSAHEVPVSRLKLGSSSDPISEPPEFAQVQSWINALKTADLIEPTKLQEIQNALDQMKEQPAKNWYTQDNLEAANSLKELTEQSMDSLAQDLDKADSAVQAMREKVASPSDGSSLQPMVDELSKAGENLASGNLPLKRELVDQLRGGESASDKSLSAKQLEELHDRLKKGETAARTAANGKGDFSDEMQKAMADAASGKGEGRRRVGSGGRGGGTESAPLELQPRENTTPPGTLTPVSNDDMSRAALGETLKVTASEHSVDPAAYTGPQNAGAAQVAGTGGQAVWRSTYDPQEADTLDNFFK